MQPPFMLTIRIILLLSILFATLMLTQNTPLAVIDGQAPPNVGSGASAPVLLTVYIYDRCGGCGDNAPGCGECVDTINYHSVIKKQLGNRLYDGTIVYRMYNCRLHAHEDARVERGIVYGVPDALLHIRPIAYIGGEDGGVYLPGDASLELVGEMLDRYVGGEPAAVIQNDINDFFDIPEREDNDDDG